MSLSETMSKAGCRLYSLECSSYTIKKSKTNSIVMYCVFLVSVLLSNLKYILLKSWPYILVRACTGLYYHCC